MLEIGRNINLKAYVSSCFVFICAVSFILHVNFNRSMYRFHDDSKKYYNCQIVLFFVCVRIILIFIWYRRLLMLIATFFIFCMNLSLCSNYVYYSFCEGWVKQIVIWCHRSWILIVNRVHSCVYVNRIFDLCCIHGIICFI